MKNNQKEWKKKERELKIKEKGKKEERKKKLYLEYDIYIYIYIYINRGWKRGITNGNRYNFPCYNNCHQNKKEEVTISFQNNETHYSSLLNLLTVFLYIHFPLDQYIYI